MQLSDALRSFGSSLSAHVARPASTPSADTARCDAPVCRKQDPEPGVRVRISPQAEQAGVEQTAVEAAVARKERGSIELRTQDGDLVRIRFRTREAEHAAVNATAGPEGTSVSAQLSTRQSSRLRAFGR
jgi:hypothetical protein